MSEHTIESLHKRIVALEEIIQRRNYTDLVSRDPFRVIGPGPNGYNMTHPCTLCGSFDHDALSGHSFKGQS